MPDTLESLLASALAQQEVRKQRRRTLNPVANLFGEDHWKKTRVVALVHDSTATLLGAFQEYLHASLPNCRKLTRLTEPGPIDGTEYVEGEQWIRPLLHPRMRLETKYAEIDAILPALGLRALGVRLACTVASDGIHSARLMFTTSFVDNEMNRALFLPERMDILFCLSTNCKLNLRAELGL
jgi:hypothetical protein